MDSTNETGEPARAPASQSALLAIRLFYVLVVLKVFGLAFGIRLLVNPVLPAGAEAEMRASVAQNAKVFGLGLIIWYALGVTLCLVVIYALKKRKSWSFASALSLAALHAVGILAAPFVGAALFISGAIGIVLIGTLIRAKSAEPFDDTATPGAVPPHSA